MGDSNADADRPSLCFNGIDGATGAYLTPSLTVRQVAKLAASESFDAHEVEELTRKWMRASEDHFAPVAGIDAQNLSQTGWGVVFGPDANDAVKEALQPLVTLRREQAGDRYSDFPDHKAFRAGDTKNTFLGRSGVGPGPANPKKIPYYLLIVGSPDVIPFRFQYQLDVQHAVGRLHFTTPEEYANYAENVVAAESGRTVRPRRLTMFGVRNSGDQATQLSADHLITPLADSVSQTDPTWACQRLIGPEATREGFLNMLCAEEAPALLVSASHGMGFPNGDPRQLAHQGAILCQDWPGPLGHMGPLPEDFYVAAEHIPSNARFNGLVALFFACYGVGTPRTDDFTHLLPMRQGEIAPFPFVAALPNELLGRPRGALAVIGHVERAWTYSFVWPGAGRQLEVFESAITSLLSGQRVGSAMEWFNSRYAEIASDLCVALEDRKYRRTRTEEETRSEDQELAGMWTANNDARSYVVIGDPAVKLAVSGGH